VSVESQKKRKKRKEKNAKMREREERKKEYKRKEMMLKSEFHAFSRSLSPHIMRLQNLAL
jgi:hypothetical protein